MATHSLTRPVSSHCKSEEARRRTLRTSLTPGLAAAVQGPTHSLYNFALTVSAICKLVATPLPVHKKKDGLLCRGKRRGPIPKEEKADVGDEGDSDNPADLESLDNV